MYPYLGNFATGATIFFPFATYDSNGASVTITGLAVTDIEVYKGASMTQRASDAGYTLVDTDGTDLDGIVGIHGFTIDTSDNTDAGFYAAGNDYTVVVSSITADSQTVNFIAGRFSIENRATTANVTKWNSSNVAAPNTAGYPLVDVGRINDNADSATKLALSANQIYIGTAFAGTLDVTRVDSDDIDAVLPNDDVPIGGILIPTSGDQKGTRCRISDYAVSGGVATITLDSNTPLRAPMADDDTFIIV